MTGVAERYAAQGLEVTPDMLVNEQVARLMQSPVGKIAKDIAIEYMNSRGMMDSSAAMSAIIQATIKAGLPIAEKDAATYFNAANETVAAENAARAANASAANTMTNLNMNAVNAQRQWEAQQATEANKWSAEKSFDDYWKRLTLSEEQRQFDLTYQLEQLEAVTRADSTEADIAAQKMSFIMTVAGAPLSKDEIGRILSTAVGMNLISQQEADRAYMYMPGVELEDVV
jgi:hypothetical protein